jgi:hypothetical protein
MKQQKSLTTTKQTAMQRFTATHKPTLAEEYACPTSQETMKATTDKKGSS